MNAARHTIISSSHQVFHTRLPHFPVQAERLIDPTLATRAVAIITSSAQSGTIIDLSDEARQEGCARGMHVSLARKMSRRVVLIPFNTALYQKVQATLLGRLNRFSPRVEPTAYGSFFLDMSGLVGLYDSYRDAGHSLVSDVVKQIDLTPKVGIGRNKLVTAIATRLPVDDPVLEVSPGDEVPFLAPLYSGYLPVSREKPVRRALDDLNLMVVADIQRLVTQEHIARIAFGLFARRIVAQAQGIDTSLVSPPQQWGYHLLERYTLPEDTNDEGRLLGAVQHLADVVGFQLRRQGQVALKTTLTIHYTDGYEGEASGPLSSPSAKPVSAGLRRLYEKANRRRQRVRAVTVRADHLTPFARQLSLFEENSISRESRLSGSLDWVRHKYGADSVRSAIMLG